MGIKEWYKSGSQSIRLGQNYMQGNNDRADQQHGWRTFWRKIKRDKSKKVFSSPVTMQASYDPSTYSKNFDQGMVWTEPDNLARSFSARFADPNKIFPTTFSLLD